MTTLEQARLAGAAKMRNSSHRAQARAYIEAQGDSTLTEVSEGLHWTRDFTRRVLAHAVEAGVLRIVRDEGGKRFAVGNEGVRFPVPVKEKKVPHPERIAGLTIRHQITRERLASNERARLSYEERLGVVRVA